MPLAAIWLLIKQFKGPILIAVGVLSVWGMLGYWGHTKYQDGFQVGHKEAVAAQKELKETKELFAAEVVKWNKQIADLNKQLDEAKKVKQEVVKKNLEDLFKKQKSQTKERTTREANLKINIKPTDIVIVPSEFERVYNSAIEGSRSAVGDSGNVQVSKDRPGPAGETKTFDALAFSQVVIGNIETYNALALQCGKLIDTVNQLEESYGTNIKGPEGQVSTDGGNVPDGVAGTRLSNAGGSI